MRYEDGSKESGVEEERLRTASKVAAGMPQGQQACATGSTKQPKKRKITAGAATMSLADYVQPGDVCAICLGEPLACSPAVMTESCLMQMICTSSVMQAPRCLLLLVAT